jgi:hypothetical protein
MEITLTFITILLIVAILLSAYLIILHQKNSKSIDLITNKNSAFLESIEKYVEIFNVQNVKDLLNKDEIMDESLANKKIETIRNDYKKKLLSHNSSLTEEQEMLVDFVTLTLSLLIKTPPNLRLKLIDENTDNITIKKILISKLASIERHYIPVSILEVAIAKDEN